MAEAIPNNLAKGHRRGGEQMTEPKPVYTITPSVPDVEVKVECEFDRRVLLKARRARKQGRAMVLVVHFAADGTTTFFNGVPDGRLGS